MNNQEDEMKPCYLATIVLSKKLENLDKKVRERLNDKKRPINMKAFVKMENKLETILKILNKINKINF